jgi:CheY-like chemotaxis protein
MKNEQQKEYRELRGTQLRLLEQTLESLREKKALAESLRKANVKAARKANTPEEIHLIEGRYRKEITGIESAIRRIEKQMGALEETIDLAKERVLIVDDERNIRLTLSRSLESLGVQIENAVNGEEALQKLQEDEFGLLLLDLKMPGIDGMDVLHHVQERWPKTRVIVITAHGTIDSAVEAMKVGAVDFIQKPFSPAEIRELVTKVLKRRQAG